MASVHPQLLDFAGSSSSGTESVIVEVATARVAAPARGGASARQGAPAPGGKRAAAPGAEGRAFSAVQAALRALGAEAVELRAVSSFVVDLTPAQLREIAQLPEVAAIRPNASRGGPPHVA